MTISRAKFLPVSQYDMIKHSEQYSVIDSSVSNVFEVLMLCQYDDMMRMTHDFHTFQRNEMKGEILRRKSV